MEEELFTSAEISSILMESTNPIYQMELLWHPTSSKYQIFKISRKGLIFVHGNSHTGMEHIAERHNITSRKLYFKDGKYDDPTKFNLAPVEYPWVADVIYDPANLNTEKNKRPDIFDLYIGPFAHNSGQVYHYVLLVYKYTGIVHTFFLKHNSKPFNKKVKLPLRQGWTSSRWNVMTCMHEYTLHYRDINNGIKVTVLLRSDTFSGFERWYLQVYNGEEIFFTHFVKQESVGKEQCTPLRMGQLDFQDLSFIDKIIMKIISNEYDFGDGYGDDWFYFYK